MPHLQPTYPVPLPRPRFRAQVQRGRSNTAHHPGIHLGFSAHHLDHVSHHHAYDSYYEDDDIETEYDDDFEQVAIEDHHNEAIILEDVVPEVRMGNRNTRVLDVDIEMKPITKSTKDPNLVRVLDCKIFHIGSCG